MDGFFNTLLRELEERTKNRTPIRLALDGRSPPSYGNGGKRLENATLILLDVGRASLTPLRSLRIWSKMRPPSLKSVGRAPRTPLRDLPRRNFSTPEHPPTEVQDSPQPPSYGNGRKRVANATLTRNMLDGSRPPPLRKTHVSKVCAILGPPYAKCRTDTSHPPTEMEENVLKTRPSYCWTLDGLL